MRHEVHELGRRELLSTISMDDDAVAAAADLVGRSGARNLQVGYLHEGVPVEEAGWYAHAQYQGARLTTEDHRGPVEALEALARRILTGAKCVHCGGLVALSDDGAYYMGGTMADGSVWTRRQAHAAGHCRWRRMGPKWLRGCEKSDNGQSKKKNKKKRKRRR